jgi:hypothetical protein
MLCLCAGTVQSLKSDPFPSGDVRPSCTMILLADDMLIRCVGYDEQATALESLAVGDACSIQGLLQIETRQSKLAALRVLAQQVLPLRKRSANRVPAAAMA